MMLNNLINGTTTPKSIPVTYNGEKYRSKLEGRIALFFDELGIDYYHEPNTENAGNRNSYIPDFYLPDMNIYVEAKGSDSTLKTAYYNNCSDLDRIYDSLLYGKFMPNSKGVMLINSIPFFDSVISFQFPVYAFSTLSNVNGKIAHKTSLLIPHAKTTTENYNGYCRFETYNRLDIDGLSEYDEVSVIPKKITFDFLPKDIRDSLNESRTNLIRIREAAITASRAFKGDEVVYGEIGEQLV